ncbi:MAG: CDP-diacylglycerol--serine O-phosphatidyltransferase [Tannerellaceae bacterium]|jgi:CDP-diacylglycerol--serine O-phosphatidyltransferase|nr:CDP-diacylglycerol--serine O-phosphatidyltransferase [Tannerellaceae bacterium]
MNIRAHIPNFITCLSLVSGCLACVMAIEGRFQAAQIYILAAATFDFLDGFFARLLHAYSAIGKELDSLSDIVSFGVAPGMIIFRLLRDASCGLPFGVVNMYIPFLAFVIPVFSALRLAKFNIDHRQATSFIGLPVPAHALFWSSLAYVLQPLVRTNEVLFSTLLLLSVLLTSLLLVSEIPMFSLKAKSTAWKGNELRYVMVICTIGFILFFQFPGIAAAVLLYVLLSVLTLKGK